MRRGRVLLGVAVLGGVLVLPEQASVRAATPSVTIKPGSVRIQVAQATLAETLDALSRSANFKITYDGPRPAGMLYNTEVDTPSVSQTLTRLLDGQNINYAVLFDRSGQNVVTLLVLGPASRTGVVGTGNAGGRPSQPFATPRSPRNDLPPVDDDPNEAPEATPAPTPEPSPSATPLVRPPFSPFGPRPFGSPPPQPPRPSPTASP